MAKIRLDVYLVENNLTKSRETAKCEIMAGNVYVNNDKCDKCGTTIKDSDVVVLRGSTQKYVSRGGYKLEKAIQSFGIDLNKKICYDIGASTGGFTDCMLQNSASRVYAIDVGYGQLAWKLRTDERVINLERTNVRYVTREMLDKNADFASIDVAFISLKLVIPAILPFLNENAHIVALIKPQFEAGREKVGKKGVVKDINVHIDVCEMIYDFSVGIGLFPTDFDYSPIKGPEGNIEYLIYLSKSSEAIIDKEKISQVVSLSHNNLAQ